MSAQIIDGKAIGLKVREQVAWSEGARAGS